MSENIDPQSFGGPTQVAGAAEPTPTVERVPRTADGSTWYAHAEGPGGQTIGATARTKRGALTQFSEQWARFTS